MSKDSSNLSDDAPILSLIEKPIDSMTQEELQAHVSELQEASANVQAVKKRINKNKSSKKKGKTVKARASSAADDLLNNI